VARKAGPLLLIAFLLAIVAGGGGGVRVAPWMPRSPRAHPEPVTVAQARVAAGASWQVHRME
jgi:hypothetical protein